ncbi:GNAT family N-acetyltransferase [Ruegeria arenilitoris]|uniref:GNAT family N-acetyltransferase n=1 Tax=Ruegeria arenilitoris TaxID=1173585 RepID=UPI00147A0C2B|nr:GNAT family N-acetyltransferase [Ruegeria arenilitoris]
MLSIVEPKTPDQFDAVRRLCWDYHAYLLTLDERSRQVVNTFYPPEKYAAVLSAIEIEHMPPKGGTRLAMLDGLAVGCGMFQTIGPGIAEIKRVFVTDDARGTGAGCGIMQALIAQCRKDGFEMIRMDTGKPLEAATRLYLSLGFKLRDAYSDIPEIAQGQLLFFEMSLADDSAEPDGIAG